LHLNAQGDESVLDFAVMRELGKALTPGEIEKLWTSSQLGARDKARARKDYRRRTIWNAIQDAKKNGYVLENPPICSACNELFDVTGQCPKCGNTTPPASLVISPPKTYLFSAGMGLERIDLNKRVRLANFKPEIIRSLEIDYGDDKATQAYDLRFVRIDGLMETRRFTEEDLESDRTVRRRLVSLSEKFIVYPAGWTHIWSAAQELAEDTPYDHVRVFAHMGWANVEGKAVYLLPSMLGGITSEGLDSSYRMDPSAVDALPAKMRLYGIKVQPAVSTQEKIEISTVFERLVSVSDATVDVSSVVQALSGPLSSLGIRTSPPLVHLLGRTGALKTTRSEEHTS